MPRVKKAPKTSNGLKNNADAGGDGVVSSTTNSGGSIFSEEDEVVQKVEETPGPSKVRGRAKKVVTPITEAVVAAAVVVKKPTAKGRPKKSTEKLESVETIEEVPKPAKGAGRGRKKKEPEPDAADVAPEKLPEKKNQRAVAAKVKDYKEEEIDMTNASQENDTKPPVKRGRAKKSATPEEIFEEKLEKEKETQKNVVKKPATKRGRAKKSATPEVDEEPIEAAPSPKKKAKPAATDKKKRGAAKAKTSPAADIDEEDEEEEQNVKEVVTTVVEVAEVKAEKSNRKTKIEKPAKASATAEEKPKRQRKRAAVVVEEDEEKEDDADDEVDGSKPSKAKKAAPLNATGSAYNKADFDLPPLENGDEESITAKRFNLKISSWNVAGLRAWLKKDGLKFLEYEEPDIFCMQETKCTTDQLPEEATRIPGYHPYWLCFPGGHDGVAIYSKIMPIHVEYGIGNAEFDEAGRLITAEYEKFFLINVYVPNSGRKLVRLEPRMRWEKLFQVYVTQLETRKPVIICGDMNVSHREIDLANPKANTRNAGYTQEERDKMSELLALGYIDTFRLLYPERKGAYTFWTYLGNARARNVGWRLDYFLVSERLSKRVVENCMRTQCMGSDHCPITLFLKM